MVRVKKPKLLILFFISPCLLYAEERLQMVDYSGEAKIILNYAAAIATYYKANGEMPKTLEDIRDNTVLGLDFGSSHAATVPQRYMLLDAPLSFKNGSKVLMVSIPYFVSREEAEKNLPGGRMVALLTKDGGSSMRVPADEIDPLIKAAGITLRPIGGEVPMPTFPLIPQKPVTSETMQRALEMKARGELTTPPRRDQETWRDQKPPAPTPTPAPVASSLAKSSNPLWWIAGAVAALLAIVLFVRRKKPKT
jgi:hypothetical protein